MKLPNNTMHTIGETADLVGISISTLRMYEREGLIIPQRRNSKHRRFSHDDIERIRCVRAMINAEKVSIAGMRRMLSLIPCWKVKNCSTEVREKCAAFTQHDKPCWMVSGKSWASRSEHCRVCRVYTEFAHCATLKKTIADITLHDASLTL